MSGQDYRSEEEHLLLAAEREVARQRFLADLQPFGDLRPTLRQVESGRFQLALVPVGLPTHRPRLWQT